MVTIQPDDGYEELRGALGRLYALLNCGDRDTFTAAEIYDALSGPELTAHADPDTVRWYVHRQTRQPGMVYTPESARRVLDWISAVHRSADQPGKPLGPVGWEYDTDSQHPGAVWVETLHGPVLMRYGDTLMLDARGWPYPVHPEVLALVYHEEH